MAEKQSGDTELQTTSQCSGSAVYKYLSLVLLTVQSTAFILVVRYTRTRDGQMFITSTAVIMNEAVKFSVSLLVIFYLEGFSLKAWWNHLHQNIFSNPWDCLKISVPSIVYVVQNNLVYLAISNLDAVTFQVTSQLKILTTALFSVLILKKKLTIPQWISLVFLFLGVALIQVQSFRADSKPQAQKQNKLIGTIAVLISGILSGFAGVYFEKILKGSSQSLWVRNIQLGAVGILIGFLSMGVTDGKMVSKVGFFFKYDSVVCLLIAIQAFGGLLVAVVVKYADNIMKGFATSAAIVLSCVLSIYLFDFILTTEFTMGTSLVVVAVYMYSYFVPVQEKEKVTK